MEQRKRVASLRGSLVDQISIGHTSGSSKVLIYASAMTGACMIRICRAFARVRIVNTRALAIMTAPEN